MSFTWSTPSVEQRFLIASICRAMFGTPFADGTAAGDALAAGLPRLPADTVVPEAFFNWLLIVENAPLLSVMPNCSLTYFTPSGGLSCPAANACLTASFWVGFSVGAGPDSGVASA